MDPFTKDLANLSIFFGNEPLEAADDPLSSQRWRWADPCEGRTFG